MPCNVLIAGSLMTVDIKLFEQNYYRVAYLFSLFTVPYMRNIYREFGGDMLLNIVVGEIGTRNVSQFFQSASLDTTKHSSYYEAMLDEVDENPRLLRPCNALSISDATGIPRETVRRKVNALIKMGWVQQNEKGHLYLTSKVAKHFERFLLSSIESLLPAAHALDDVLTFPEDKSAGTAAE